MTVHSLSGPPVVSFREDGRRVLFRDFVVDLGERVQELHSWDLKVSSAEITESATGTTIIFVPAGFDYDGASIPLLSQYLMGRKELYEQAGCVHDALYRWRAPRGASDYVFWLIARSGSKQVGPVRGWLGWAALRAFGGLAWRRR